MIGTMTPLEHQRPLVNHYIEVTVRLAMAARQWTVRETAQAIGLSKSALYLRLNRERDFTAAEVAALGEVFGMDPADIMTGHAARDFLPQTADGYAPPDSVAGIPSRRRRLPRLDSNQQPADRGTLFHPFGRRRGRRVELRLVQPGERAS